MATPKYINFNFVQNSNEETNVVFEKRANYIYLLINPNINNIIDFNMSEKMFYGRMKQNQNAIYLKSSKLLKTFKNSPTTRTPARAINFVVDAFEMLRADMAKAAALNKISSDDKYLSDLKVFKAYDSPTFKYQKYLEFYIEKIGRFMKDDAGINYKDLNEFFPILDNVVQTTIEQLPFSFSAFIKSNYCDIMNTGLAIEISDLKYENDEEKVKQLINSPNWNYFVNACNNYGFIIDANVPWRIVADINSDRMKELQLRYDASNGYNILNSYYTEASTYMLGTMPDIIAKLYQAGKVSNYKLTEPCENGKMITKIITPRNYTWAQIISEIKFSKLAEMYFKIRAYEAKPDMSDSNIAKLITDTIKATINAPENNRISYFAFFESIMSLTFDKIHSNEYNRVNMKKKSDYIRSKYSFVVGSDNVPDNELAQTQFIENLNVFSDT